MNVLVIAPHPDDEVIGCGGSVCLHVEKGDAVSFVFLTSGELGLKELSRDQARARREAEAARAAEILSVRDLSFLRCGDWMLEEEQARTSILLRAVIAARRPQLIYAPHPKDAHPDHRVTASLIEQALHGTDLEKVNIRFYEVWTPLQEFTCLENVSRFMERKLAALRAHESQVIGSPAAAERKFDYVRAVSGLNQYRGALAGNCEYAEAFLEQTAPVPARS